MVHSHVNPWGILRPLGLPDFNRFATFEEGRSDVSGDPPRFGWNFLGGFFSGSRVVAPPGDGAPSILLKIRFRPQWSQWERSQCEDLVIHWVSRDSGCHSIMPKKHAHTLRTQECIRVWGGAVPPGLSPEKYICPLITRAAHELFNHTKSNSITPGTRLFLYSWNLTKTNARSSLQSPSYVRVQIKK